MIIREFSDGDRPATFEVFCRAIQGTASRDYSPEQVAAWIGDDRDPHAGGYIDMLVVDPDYARRGVEPTHFAMVTQIDQT